MSLSRRTRRHFIKQAAATTVTSAAAIAAAPWLATATATATATAVTAPQASGEKTPFPYVDGLSFLGPPADIAASGLSALICDVSAAERLKTDDGSIKYFRSFDACARSLTSMRRQLNSGQVPGVFLATKGSEIPEAHRNGRTAVFFQFQGCEPIGDDLTRLELFYELGLRVLQITHHNNNAWGGGAIERTWTGLTKTGKEGVERLNALGIIPDLSHVSDVTSLDVLRISKRPVILSHGAARALVNNARCASDEVIKGVANSGGAVGIFMMSFWLTTEPTPTAASYVAQIRHVVNVAGIEAVGIANDYPIGGEQAAIKVGNDNAAAIKGYLPWWESVRKQGVLGFDAQPAHVVIPELNHPRRAYAIHDALAHGGFKTPDIEKIMGGNWTRVLTDSLG
jgi:membrane dipeptidase